jgi:peptidylprolyl isomerase
MKTAFSLKYQDTKIGTGADAEPGKLYKVNYTGYRAADGVKFDSSFDHPGQPEKDKDGKPVLGDDGKPKLGDPQPMAFPQGMGRLIPGFDQGFAGMKIGGKRRLFIPWQLAYGTRVIPDHPAAHPGDVAHPGIPAKSDLIFDVELVDVSEMPTPPNHPGMGGPPGSRPMPGGPPHPGAPGAPATPPAPGSAPASAAPAAPGSPATPGATPAPAAPSTPPPAAAPATPPASTVPATPAPPQPK